MAPRWAYNQVLGKALHKRIRCKKVASIRYSSTRFGPLHISEEVQEAVQSKKPVVALETTIYTHGFPYPENIALSSRLESIVRQNGGIPATIGILNGIAKVGFEAEELIELLSTAGSPSTVKVSRRDLGLVCGRTVNGKKLNGGTTIAGTLVLAHLAGIHIFATGGLGGVHRGGESSLDISADLTELGRTPVALVSSGCKSFLDIPRTLEYLETQGVSVSTFADGREGQIDFPAFWTRDSGVPSPMVVRDEHEAAAIIHAQLSFPLSSGMLFANPIPDSSSLAKSQMDKITAEAIQEAHAKGATGSDNTPFVLKYIREATKGATVAANTALVEANVRRGTLVATELARLRLRHQNVLGRQSRINLQQKLSFSTISARDRGQAPGLPVYRNPLPETNDTLSPPVHGSAEDSQTSTEDGRNKTQAMPPSLGLVDVVVAGSVAMDLSCDYRPLTPPSVNVQMKDSGPSHSSKLNSSGTLKLATSNPASIRSRIGGVGHNVALALHYLGVPVGFYSAVGNDSEGIAIIIALKSRGILTEGIQRHKECRTAQYVALNNLDKSLFTAAADMSIFDREVDKGNFRETWQPLLEKQRPKWIILDANWSSEALELWTDLAKSSTYPTQVVFEPVSIEKSTRVFPLATSKNLLRRKPSFNLTTPNEYELEAMFECVTSPDYLAMVAQEKERYNGCQEDSPSLEILMSSFNESVTQCLSRVEQHNSPRRNEVEEAAAKAIYLLRYFETVLVKFGSSGILQVSTLFKNDPRIRLHETRPFLVDRKASRLARISHPVGSVEEIYLRWHPPAVNLPADQIVSVNGVGDTFLGVLVAGLARTKQQIEELVHIAQLGAVMTLKSPESVSEKVRTLEPMTGGILARGRAISMLATSGELKADHVLRESVT